MPSNDDLKHQSQEAANDRDSSDAPVAPVLPDYHAAGANEASAALFSSDNSIPHEFTFFQKKKRAVQVVLAPSVAYASTAKVTAFLARLDSAVEVNDKTQRHIAELMTLMSDVARTTTAHVAKPTRKSLRRSKWLFWGCSMGFGVGWFLLFPSGHSLLTQLAAFLAK